jgi:hypothetical protein
MPVNWFSCSPLACMPENTCAVPPPARRGAIGWETPAWLAADIVQGVCEIKALTGLQWRPGLKWLDLTGRSTMGCVNTSHKQPLHTCRDLIHHCNKLFPLVHIVGAEERIGDEQGLQHQGGWPRRAVPTSGGISGRTCC